MTETQDISNLRTQFAKKAILPEKQIARAQEFLTHIADSKTATKEDLRTGQRLLHSLEHRTELFEFHAAVLAGQESLTEKELARRVDEIAKSAEVAEQTTHRLREALKGIEG